MPIIQKIRSQTCHAQTETEAETEAEVNTSLGEVEKTEESGGTGADNSSEESALGGFVEKIKFW